MEAWIAHKRANKTRVTALTLTYDPKQYSHEHDPALGEIIYDDLKASRHLPRFIERLQKYLGYSLCGKWRAKLEFTERGWPHFHVLISAMPYVPKTKMDDLWGHGFTYLQEAKKGTGVYVAKYQSKSSPYPDFLYDRPVGSVKIWHTSPGFFDSVKKSDRLVTKRLIAESDVEHVHHCVHAEPKTPERVKTIRQQIESVNGCKVTSEGYAASLDGMDLSCIAIVFAQLGIEYVETKYGSRRYNATRSEIERGIRIALTTRRIVDTEDDFEAALDYYSNNAPENRHGTSDAQASLDAGAVPLFNSTLPPNDYIPDDDQIVEIAPYREGMTSENLPI